MKLTPEITKFVEKKLRQYAIKKLKLKGEDIPEVFFDGVALKEKRKAMMRDKEFMAHYIFGDDIRLIHINLAVHKTLEELEDSIAHEIIHLTNPELKHGKKFDKRVEDLKNG